MPAILALAVERRFTSVLPHYWPKEDGQGVCLRKSLLDFSGHWTEAGSEILNILKCEVSLIGPMAKSKVEWRRTRGHRPIRGANARKEW